MWREFREFIARGNVVDLAVGVVIGAAFATVIDSFVADILMPPIGMLTGGVDFSNLFVDLSGRGYRSLAEAQAAGAPTINYGVFLNTVISFFIVVFAVFLFIRHYNRWYTAEASQAAIGAERECPYCRLKIPEGASRCAHCTSELITP